MNLDQVRAWLRTRGDDLSEFADYVPELLDDATFADELDVWFTNAKWRDGGDRFASLGQNNDGTMFAAWTRPGAGEPCVVMFGGEGDLEVKAPSLEAWVKALAHGPDMETMDPEDNWIFDEEEMPEAFVSYADAVEAEFGPLEPLDALLAGVDERQRELQRSMSALTGVDFTS